MNASDLKSLFGVYADRKDFFLSSFSTYISNPNAITKHDNSSIEKLSKFLLDPHVWACVQSRVSGTLTKKWRVVKGLIFDLNFGEKAVKVIEKSLGNLDMERIIEEILDAPLYGYKPFEIFWDYKGGYLVPIDIIGKPSWWFDFDENGMIYFQDNKKIAPKYKMLVAKHKATYINPYGIALLRKIYNSLQFKHGGFELWSLAVAKYGLPFIKAKVNKSVQPEELSQIATQLVENKENGAIVTDDNVDVEIEPSPVDPAMYREFINYCNAEISKAILSQTLTTEQGDTGSYAMSQTHLQVRDDVVDSDTKIVENFFNDLIQFICELNFPASILEPPGFELYSEKGADITLAQRDQIIFAIPGVKPTKTYLTRNHNFKDDEIEIVEATQPASQPAFNEYPIDNALQNPNLDEMDGFVREILISIIDLVKDDSTKSLAEIQESLIQLFPAIETEKIQDFIGKALIIGAQNGMLRSY